ncbi:MAG TPA: ribose-phosphate diphosphokinase [Gammaproteobacteria bacterium]|nr:ribose-phosphate diphosphokinase [Gammaproteobacteria bacterium]
MKLYGLGDTRAFAERVAAELGVPLAAHEERDFEDGEFKIRPLDSVRRERVFVCQSLAADQGVSSNDKLVRLLVFCGALKEAGAEAVTAAVPYLAYARKDRRSKPRDPVTTSYLARMFESVGVDMLATIDVHNVASFDNAFRCRKENLEGVDVFAAHFAPRTGSAGRVVVLSPDAGGVARARGFAAALGARLGRSVELAFVEKQRSEGRVSGSLFAGDVRDALVVIYDDMVSTGGTLARAASACAERGARVVHAATTHGLFAGDAVRTLNGAPIESVVVLNTVPGVERRMAGLRAECHVLDCAGLFARAIERWSGESHEHR